MTRAGLRAEIAKKLGIWIAEGTVLASPTPTASYFASTSLTGFTPAELVGKLLAITATGTNSGAERRIISFDNSNWAITLRYALPATTATGNTFEIYTGDVGYERLTQAIINCVNGARDIFLAQKFDRSLTVAAATYEYTLPSGFAYVSKVNLEHEDDRFDMPLANDDWEIAQSSGVTKLRLRRSWILGYAGQSLELRGQSFPTAPAADSTANPIPDEYVIAWVCYMLGSERPMGQSEAGWRERLQTWRQTFLDIIQRERTGVFPGAQRVP